MFTNLQLEENVALSKQAQSQNTGITRTKVIKAKINYHCSCAAYLGTALLVPREK